jgi:predicted AAA+ superfamily ATPase
VGRSWESFIIEEILKGLACALIPVTPYFMRTRHGAEVDLVLEGHFGLLPIEVKYGTTVDHRSLRALRDFVEQYRLELGIVICNADSAAWLGDKILRLPATVL